MACFVRSRGGSRVSRSEAPRRSERRKNVIFGEKKGRTKKSTGRRNLAMSGQVYLTPANARRGETCCALSRAANTLLVGARGRCPRRTATARPEGRRGVPSATKPKLRSVLLFAVDKKMRRAEPKPKPKPKSERKIRVDDDDAPPESPPRASRRARRRTRPPPATAPPRWWVSRCCPRRRAASRRTRA